jgi:tRNA pseudouridine13 synthase
VASWPRTELLKTSMWMEGERSAQEGAVSAHPYLTKMMPGIGGKIKVHVEDFQVEELPLYAPSGDGEHTFFEIQKSDLTTFQALGVPPNRIGYAGLKDKRATTSQVLSVQGVPPDEVSALDLPQVRVMWADRNRKKLKVGHLRGNRFTIRVREVGESALLTCRTILDELVRRGVPNRYGPQRFGLRSDSAALGRAIVLQDEAGFILGLLGKPHAREAPMVQDARAQFDAGHWREALHLLPGGMADERHALEALIRTGGDYHRAYVAVSKRLKVFLLSAYQSVLFNQVLDARLQSLDRVQVGDLAMIHPGHSVFRVEDEAAEQARAARFEISSTGPVFGYKMTQASGAQGELEAGVLAEEDVTLESFRVGGGIRARGARRALRFPIHEPEVWFDEGVMLRFWLPRGCYATTVLSEIMKTENQDVMDLTKL